MKKKYFPLFCIIFLISGCTSNKAIRGGEVVDSYNISEINLPIEEIHFKNLDGTALYAWFIKKENYHQIPTIIFLHGSRENISDYLPVIRNLYQSIDANIFACDFPATGASKGKMSLRNTYQMTLASIDYLSSMPDIRQDEIVLYGASMGASLAFYGASKREHVIVIIDSGVTSASDYMKKYSVIGLPDFLIWLFGENFNNYAIVKNIKSPKLFLHGKRDPFIDIRYAHRLYDQASEPKDCLWMDGGHVLFGNPAHLGELSKKVRAFLSAHLPQ
jgi:pimeloyl-ACP methyl ester carboxylesterase